MLQMTATELCVVVLIGVALAAPVGGAFIRRISQLNRVEASFFEGASLKVVLTIMVVVLGLLAWIITPVLPLLALIGAAKLLPIERGARASFVVIGFAAIGLGAALTTADLPLSQIAILKLQGSAYQATLSGMLGL
jgi:predicted cation transporter